MQIKKEKKTRLDPSRNLKCLPQKLKSWFKYKHFKHLYIVKTFLFSRTWKYQKTNQWERWATTGESFSLLFSLSVFRECKLTNLKRTILCYTMLSVSCKIFVGLHGYTIYFCNENHLITLEKHWTIVYEYSSTGETMMQRQYFAWSRDAPLFSGLTWDGPQRLTTLSCGHKFWLLSCHSFWKWRTLASSGL